MEYVMRVCGTCSFYSRYEGQAARCKAARNLLSVTGYTVDVVETYCLNDATTCPSWEEKAEPQCIRCKHATYDGGRYTTCGKLFPEKMAFRLRVYHEGESSKNCFHFEHC